MKAAIIGLAFLGALTLPAAAEDACTHDTLPHVLDVIRTVPGTELFGVKGPDADKFNTAILSAFGQTSDVHPAFVLIAKAPNGNILGFAFDLTGCETAGGNITPVYDAALAASGIAPPEDLGAGSAIPDIKLPLRYIVPGKNDEFLLRT